MSGPGFRSLTSRSVALLRDDVDTDQIVPARFLKITTREGLGNALFADWRFDAGGQPRADFVLNRPEAEGARILLAGRNFGCGSSREHAVWALAAFGFQAVIALSFADIFQGNALQNGLLPVALAAEPHARLCAAAHGQTCIDLEAQTVLPPDGVRVPFEIEPFARRCLLQGQDALGYLLACETSIAAFESRRLTP
jgi:3-isopropylmalate/(R)-2-methylmalate dehydratase small subunit